MYCEMNEMDDMRKRMMKMVRFGGEEEGQGPTRSMGGLEGTSLLLFVFFPTFISSFLARFVMRKFVPVLNN